MEGPSETNQINLGLINSGSDVSYGVSIENAGCSRAVAADGDGDAVANRKAKDADKLAQLWAQDPKKAKRIMGNRISAAKSKKKKKSYISELESIVEALQTEAHTKTAELDMIQNDVSEITADNRELNIKFSEMENQVKLQKDLNHVLEIELVRLKISTGLVLGPGDAYDWQMLQSDSSSGLQQNTMMMPAGHGPPQITMMPMQQQYDMLLHPNPVMMMQQYDMPHTADDAQSFVDMLLNPDSPLDLDIGNSDHNSHLQKHEDPSVAAVSKNNTSS